MATKYFLLTATFSALSVLSAFAQDPQDPPTRVADLNYLAGNVSMQPAGADDWSPAVINRPLTTGDNLWADTDSRVELHLNNAVLRLGSQTSFGFLNLDDHIAQLRFNQGEFTLRVRHLGEDESFEVDTPNAAITILRDGEYRFNTDPDSAATWVVVHHGEAEVTGGGQAFTLRAGNSAQLSGTDQLTYDVGSAPPVDDLEAWAEDRDTREGRMQSARYLPPNVIGYEELDNHGTWQDTPGYGPVWYPAVEAGWAPYHDGHWSWIDPWGWTWVDDAPWGFAVSHYGRWAYVSDNRWGWIPGPMAIGGGGPAVVPVYAPALVAFIGGGGWGVSLSIGGPAVGWVPLGPGEVYAPAYQVSQNYFRTVNVANTRVVNTVNITNVYNTVYVNKSVTNVTVNQRFANMAAPNAVTAMPQTAFASGRPVKQGGIFVPRNQAGQIQTATMTVAPAVAPARQAIAPMAGNRPAPQPPQRAINMQVVAKVAPPPPPVPFAAKQAALQQNLGRPVNLPAIRQSLPPARAAVAAPPVRVAPPARQVVPQVRTVQPPPPQRGPSAAPGAPATSAPGGFRPPAQSAPSPASPTYRPPQATPPVTPRPQETAPRPQESAPRPAQPAPAPVTPSYRPPQATQPVTPRPQETTPRPPDNTNRPDRPAAPPPPTTYRPPQAAPPANQRPQETRPVQPPAATPRPPETRPVQPAPQQRPADKPAPKPKKETEKPKE